MSFFETSAKSGLNVPESFFHIAKEIKTKQEKTNPVASKAQPTSTTRGAEKPGEGSRLGGKSKKEKKKNDCCK